MGIDLKYGRVTVENVRSTPIADDEPVILFRAKDKLLPEILNHYYAICEGMGCSDEHLELISGAMDSVRNWQATNSSRTPGEPVQE